MTMLITLIISIIFILLLLYGIYILYEYDVDYCSSIPNYPSATKITFNNFYEWYYLNPNRWTLKDDYVEIEIGSKKYLGYTSINTEKCYFSYRDWKKYKEFKNKMAKKKKEEMSNKATIKILEAVQQDIDALRKQANQEIKEASDKIFEISERLNKQTLTTLLSYGIICISKTGVFVLCIA